MVFALIFSPLKSAYVFYKTYQSPQPMPIGYRNNPKPKVLPKYLGTVTQPQNLIPADLTIPDTSFVPPNIVSSPPTPIATPIPIPQPVIPTAPNAQQVAGFDNASAFQVAVGTTPVRIYNSSVPSKTVLIVADAGNTAPVFIAFNPSVSSVTGFKLPAGAGVSIPISDAGKIYLVSTASGQTISGFYLV